MCTCLENTTPCENPECGCKFEVDAGCVRYSGDNLDSAGIISGDTLETTLISISSKLEELSPGDYITMATESAGSNCEFGGVKFELRDGTTGLIKNTSYICGVNPANNAQGTVKSVAFTTTENGTDITSSVTSPSEFAAITLNIPEASATKTGKLTSSDWNKFNDKQDALSGTINYIAKWSATDDLTDSIIYETASKIGLSTIVPAAKLHINNSQAISSFLVEDIGNVGIPPFIIDLNGKVGVGTKTPSTLLNVVSSSTINNTSLATAPLLVGSTTLGIGISSSEIYAATTLSVGTFGTASDIAFKPSATQRMVIKADTGNVGIGLLDPTNSKLRIDNTASNNNSLYIESSNNTDNLPVVVKYSGAVGIGTDQPVTRFHVKQIDGNSSVPEEIARFGMDGNDTAYFSIRSINPTTGEFTPDLRGVQNTTTTDTALSLTGLIQEVQDASTPGNTFKYEAGKPAMLFRAVKTIGSEARHILNRRLFEFRNDSSVIMTMDPTGGIKVHRGDQDNKDPEADPPQGLAGAYTQYIHMHGDGAGNYIESFCAPGNTKTLRIRSTTNLANDPATNIPLSEGFPGITLEIYDKEALVVTNQRQVGIGTRDNIVDVGAKLHVTTATRAVQAGLETPGVRGEAFRMYEGYNTANQVLISTDGNGRSTWGKVNADHMDPAEGYTSGTPVIQVAKNGGGYYQFYIKNGIITNVLTFP